MTALGEAVRPDLVLWYHQDLFRISPSSGRDGEIRARYAGLTGLPLVEVTGGTYTGHRVAVVAHGRRYRGRRVHHRARTVVDPGRGDRPRRSGAHRRVGDVTSAVRRVGRRGDQRTNQSPDVIGESSRPVPYS